ncbi:hypothetical protein BVRB_6g151080 isoform C [Beta vulgaris subsp. vulgaris]|nr:hypothetical protein BVRB_6g151080 isoform C [Beta vulgaris subsp. vulgaris]
MLILNCTGRETHCLVYMLVKLVQRTGMKHLISPDQSVEGMKAVCHELAQATNEPDGSAMDDIVKDADQLVSILANKAIAVTTCVRESCPVLVLTPSSLCLHWASEGWLEWKQT